MVARVLCKPKSESHDLFLCHPMPWSFSLSSPFLSQLMINPVINSEPSEGNPREANGGWKDYHILILFSSPRFSRLIVKGMSCSPHSTSPSVPAPVGSHDSTGAEEGEEGLSGPRGGNGGPETLPWVHLTSFPTVPRVNPVRSTRSSLRSLFLVDI